MRLTQEMINRMFEQCPEGKQKVAQAIGELIRDMVAQASLKELAEVAEYEHQSSPHRGE